MTAHSNKVIAGIDPGKTGAMVILYPDNSGLVFHVPVQKIGGKEKPAWQEWARVWGGALDLNPPDMVVIENVAARPGQGVTSMFSFGRTLGFVEGIVATSTAAPLHQPTPSQWKGKMGLLKADKNASREMVRRLLPKLAHVVTRVKDDGIAEAALLALYGRQYL
jgi:crossover junction endodeoxyribonuclease RuvC